jgi:hypothetical protein
MRITMTGNGSLEPRADAFGYVFDLMFKLLQRQLL